MLSVLSGQVGGKEGSKGGQSGKNPSFEESARAINKVIEDSKAALGDVNDEEGISEEDGTVIPESYQLGRDRGY